MHAVFVILHYKTDYDTIECIDSILQLDVPADKELSVIVVDNASNNGSIEKVEELYRTNDQITILKNKENLGFAKGNNIGYQHAKNVLKADFIIILNNDTIVKTSSFLNDIEAVYTKYHFAVLGPDIISLADGGHQNPAVTTNIDLRYIKNEIRRCNFIVFLSRIGLYDCLKRKKQSSSQEYKNDSYIDIWQEDCQLHGSCLMFSPEFITHEDNAFYPGTFLYCEEAILYQYCRRKQYKLIYWPELKVLHKEDSSTSFINQTTREKRIFVLQNYVASQKVFFKLLSRGFDYYGDEKNRSKGDSHVTY